MTNQNRNVYTRPSRLEALSGMISRVNPFVGVSARIQRALTTDHLIDASTVWPDLKPGLISLIDNSKVSKGSTNEPTSDDEKKENYRKLLEYVESKHNAKACIVIFAHWCPHCKTIIQEMAEKANELSKDGISYLLVNGESVSQEAFTGPNPFVSLQYYPTILCMTGNKGKQVSSLTEARETIASAPDDDIEETKKDEKEESVDEETDKSSSIQDVLAQLF